MTPKVLVTSHVVPWPEVSGSCIRAAATIRGLTQVADVDVFVLHTDTRRPVALPADVNVDRWGGAAPVETRTGLKRFAWLFERQEPAELATVDYSGVRDAFRQWARPHYDLVWMIDGASAFLALGDLTDAPIVTNLNDLEDHKLLAQAQASGPQSHSIRAVVDPLLLRLRVGRWQRFQRRMAGLSNTVVVCSELDRQRLAVPNATVIPNIYPEPERELGRALVGDPPTVTFIGQQTYAPNADGSRWFVHEVLPRLRTLVADVQVRVVGEADATVVALGDVDHVTVTGLVADIGDELARADVIIVPLRFGGGTRIKILEAFAHRIPVVSTVIGAEGLDVEDRRHLLMADSPQGFAEACAELLTDVELRRRVTTAAHDHWTDRFTASAMAREVAALARRVLA